MATFDLGRVTPLYKGDYSASTSYELNDVVLYNGNLYWHVQATATVGILPTDATVWKLAFADEGVRAEIRGYADNAQASADSALASKSAAAQSAQTAQTAETGATASAQTASTKASEATASAQSAASSAQTATDEATLASQKAAAASESASLATARASAAATSETNAAASAQTASAKASEAAASATSAQEYDESAQQSAVNAQTAQGLAETAQTAAETAQGLAEDARDEAQQIKDNVEDAIADKADSSEIGDLSQLTTTAKDNLVAAINEAVADAEATGDAIGDVKGTFDDFVANTFESEKITGTNILPPDSVSGYWDITTGDAVENTSFSRSITSIPVQTPGSIYITTENGFSSNKVIILFMDENDEVLSYKQFSSDGSRSIPSGTIAIKVFINGVILTLDEVCLSYAQTSYVEYSPENEYTLKDDALPASLVSALNGLASDVSDIKEITDDFVHDESFFEDVTLLTKSDAQYTNGMWLENGTIATTTAALNYDAIDMIDVIPGMSYRINNFYGFYTLFDSQGINGVNSDAWTSYTNVTFTVPEGKYKIGISVRANRFSAKFKFIRTTPTQEEINSYPLLLENFTLKSYNISSNDIIKLIAPLKGQKIVNFGDSIFGNYQAESGDNMSISAMIAQRTGMVAYNAGFGGCRMAQHPTSYWDAFSMYRLADSIASSDWSLQETALTDGGSNLPDYFPSTVAMLETIDWTEIDIITIGYGTNDFTGNITEQDFKDALSDSIATILAAYPHLKILVVSPMYRWYENDDSDTHTNSNNDKLTDFCEWCKEEAELYHVPYVDTYMTLGINSINKLVYFFSTDGTHPNVKGRWLRANRISVKLLETM